MAETLPNAHPLQTIRDVAEAVVALREVLTALCGQPPLRSALNRAWRKVLVAFGYKGEGDYASRIYEINRLVLPSNGLSVDAKDALSDFFGQFAICGSSVWIMNDEGDDADRAAYSPPLMPYHDKHIRDARKLLNIAIERLQPTAHSVPTGNTQATPPVDSDAPRSPLDAIFQRSKKREREAIEAKAKAEAAREPMKELQRVVHEIAGCEDEQFPALAKRLRDVIERYHFEDFYLLIEAGDREGDWAEIHADACKLFHHLLTCPEDDALKAVLEVTHSDLEVSRYLRSHVKGMIADEWYGDYAKIRSLPDPFTLGELPHIRTKEGMALLCVTRKIDFGVIIEQARKRLPEFDFDTDGIQRLIRVLQFDGVSDPVRASKLTFEQLLAEFKLPGATVIADAAASESKSATVHTHAVPAITHEERKANEQRKAIIAQLPKHAGKAYLQFITASLRLEDCTDLVAYDAIKSEGMYILPGFDTWARSLRIARKELGEQKNSCRFTSVPGRQRRKSKAFNSDS